MLYTEMVRVPIRRVLEAKGDRVETVPIKTSVSDAVELMNARHIGALVVTSGNQVVGIITERDILTRVVARQCDPKTTQVDDVMTRELVVIGPDTTIAEAMVVITDRRCRHLPVIEDGRLCGMISSGDVTSWLARDHERTIADLYDYITR